MTDWRADLGSLLTQAQEQKVKADSSEIGRFIASVGMPAMESLADELRSHGRQVTIRNAATSAAMIVAYNGEEEISYRVQGRTFPNGDLPFAEIRFRERKGLRMISVESMLRSGAPEYTMHDIQIEDVIRNFLEHYRRRVQRT